MGAWELLSGETGVVLNWKLPFSLSNPRNKFPLIMLPVEELIGLSAVFAGDWWGGIIEGETKG